MSFFKKAVMWLWARRVAVGQALVMLGTWLQSVPMLPAAA